MVCAYRKVSLLEGRRPRAISLVVVPEWKPTLALDSVSTTMAWANSSFCRTIGGETLTFIVKMSRDKRLRGGAAVSNAVVQVQTERISTFVKLGSNEQD